MRFFIGFFLLTFGLSTSTTAQSIRQRSSTEGFSFGIQGHALGWSSEYFQYLDQNAGSGYGLGARVGYGFTQRLEGFAQYDYTIMGITNIDAEAFRFSHITAGARFNFSATTHALRPFAEVGYAYRVGEVTQVINGNRYDNILFKGGAAHIGGGINYALSLPFMLTLNGSFQTGGKAKIDVNSRDSGDKADISTFRVSVGLLVNISEL